MDFNQLVKKGQLLARIDPTLARQAVADAQASLGPQPGRARGRAEERRAQPDPARRGPRRAQRLRDLAAQLAVARANVSSARVAVERARQNLAYTEIHSPIDGVVVERNVDVGQTVAASLSAPQLFLIANDLAHMQIVVSVDESDIAAIRERPARALHGAGAAQRAVHGTGGAGAPAVHHTLENVVSYGVVVSVENQDGKLLPGMTARVEFLVDSATDVLKVANAALRFKPAGETAQATAAAAGRRQRTGSGTATSTSTKTAREEGRASVSRDGARLRRAQVWTVDGAGRLKAITVRTGLTDGVMTEVEGDGLEPG